MWGGTRAGRTRRRFGGSGRMGMGLLCFDARRWESRDTLEVEPEPGGGLFS